MPTYDRFEDVPVWQTAANLYDQLDDFLGARLSRLSFSFRNQLERAVLSISNNIAEGFERGTKNELLNFLYIARGSAGEVRSMLTILSRRPWLEHEHKSKVSSLKFASESCSRQLSAWARSLQESDTVGRRHYYTKSQRDPDKRV
jgi:four helix bundle protein